uniref:Bardet-Biedl syndrome 7 protein homolog n=1 Tax=Zooxanthella nutricula TaxID=1333877 RepID=A0A7S2VM06_9DINO
MDFALHRVELLHGEAMTKGTLVVLPVGKKKQQKIAVGDDSGVLTVFYMKKGEVQTEWKSAPLGREIACVVMQAGKDKLFVGCGQSIHGFTRKGKEFVKIKTNLTETINYLFVDENMIWTGGEYIMNIYDQCKDFAFTMVKDKINDLTCSPIAPGDILSTVMACQDKFLRVYQGDKLYHELSVEGPCTSLGYYGTPPMEREARKPNGETQMLYGTEQGMVGLCNVDAKAMRRVAGITDRQQRPGMSGPAAATRRARVLSLHTADVVKSGALDILVGREDGNLEVWSLGDGVSSPSAARLEQAPPTLTYETGLQESVQAIASGSITGSDHNELVLTTYGGKVLAFTPCQAARDPTGTEIAQVEEAGQTGATAVLNSVMAQKKKMMSMSQADQGVVKEEKQRRHKALEAEVERLKQAVEKEKAGYQRLSGEAIAMQTTTKVTHRFNLNSEEACYILTVESQAPLELISLRADVEVDLLDHDGTSAILSRAKGDPTNPLLATYRMQEDGSRFQIRLRTVEGLSGTICCFVLPKRSPKTAHLVTMAVKPLSLHEKITEVPPDVPMSELRLTGSFTVMDMHQWLSLCVNELPSRPTDDEMTISYRSTFVGTLLVGKYKKGSASFKSDSITTISVLKDVITREATARKIAVSISVDVRDETFPRFLELIHPKLAFQHALTQQVRLVEPLREVQLQEGETQFLAEELQNVLQHASEIQQQFELQPQRLAFLHTIVIAAYRHKWRLRGHQSVEPRVQELSKLLEAYNIEQVTAFFDEPID